MKTIIVATDFSESSEVALKYAAFIAKFTKANISLLNYYRFSIHVLNARVGPSAMNEMVHRNQLQLEEYAGQASRRYGVPLSCHTITSLSEETLSEFAAKEDAGIIIMGMRKELDAYSNSESISATIINHANIPVLIVPEKIEFRLPERVLYACDYRYIPDQERLKSLTEIVAAFGSELQVFHVWKNNDEESAERETVLKTTEELESSIATLKHTYKHIESKNIISGLEKGINEFKADILVMSPHRYGFWDSLFHKSKTIEMALKSTIPLLSLPA